MDFEIVNINGKNSDRQRPFRIPLETPLIDKTRDLDLPVVPDVPIKEPKKTNSPFTIQDRNWNWEQQTGFQGGASQKRKTYQVVLLSWAACAVDGLILFSMSTAFLLCFSLIMQTSFGLIFNSIFNHSTWVTYAQIYVVCAFFYLVLLRIFFGSTVGEWTFDLRLGRPTERLLKGYWFRVMERTILVFITGILPLSVASFFLKRDLSGDITGLRLYSLK